MRFANISLKESRETTMLMKFKSICKLYDLSLGEYLVNKYALWLDFRMIDENELHRTGRRIENASEDITLQIEKKVLRCVKGWVQNLMKNGIQNLICMHFNLLFCKNHHEILTVNVNHHC